MLQVAKKKKETCIQTPAPNNHPHGKYRTLMSSTPMGVVEDRSLGLFSGGPAVRCESAGGAPEQKKVGWKTQSHNSFSQV